MELALDTGAVLAIQDLGAAGLTSAAIESAAKGRARHSSWTCRQVHRRETAGMNAYEVMLSESQERMLVIVKPCRNGRTRCGRSSINGTWTVGHHRAASLTSQWRASKRATSVGGRSCRWSRSDRGSGSTACEGVEACHVGRLRAFDFSTMPADRRAAAGM